MVSASTANIPPNQGDFDLLMEDSEEEAQPELQGIRDDEPM